MSTNIKCPKCDNEFPLTDALKQQFQEQAIATLKAEFEKEKQELKISVTRDVREKALKEQKLEIQSRNEEIGELKENNKRLTDQLTQMNKTLRILQQKDEQRELEYQKKLNQDREKIKEEIGKSESEKHRLEVAELNKKLADTQKALEEAQRKAKQGSQQLQGEVLELDLEELLIRSFPKDEISEIGKGARGADVKQVVLNPRGYKCGVILWESKRQKNWSDGWLVKLKSDLRSEGADIPVIVSEVLPEEAKKGIGDKNGVYICSPTFILPLARLLRMRLLEVAFQKAVSANRTEKSQMVYSFVTSNEFRQQIEAIVEVYTDAKEQIDREKRAFEKQWKQRETQLERLLMGTANIYGKLHGIAGSAIPQVKGLELPQLDKGGDKK